MKSVESSQLQSAESGRLKSWANVNFCIHWKCLAALGATRSKCFGLPFVFKLLQSLQAAVRERMLCPS